MYVCSGCAGNIFAVQSETKMKFMHLSPELAASLRQSWGKFSTATHTHTKLARSCHCTLQLSNTLMYFICLLLISLPPCLFSLFLSAFIIWKNKATTASHVCEWGESRKQLQLIKVSGQQLPLPPDLLVSISLSLSVSLYVCLFCNESVCLFYRFNRSARKKENLHIQLSCDFKSCDFAEFKDIRVAWQPLVMPK